MIVLFNEPSFYISTIALVFDFECRIQAVCTPHLFLLYLNV